MNNTSDVIIIGLGAMGSATSMFLSHNGIKVIGFDSYSPPHEFGSSLGHTRVIRAFSISPVLRPISNPP